MYSPNCNDRMQARCFQLRDQEWEQGTFHRFFTVRQVQLQLTSNEAWTRATLSAATAQVDMYFEGINVR